MSCGKAVAHTSRCFCYCDVGDSCVFKHWPRFLLPQKAYHRCSKYCCPLESILLGTHRCCENLQVFEQSSWYWLSMESCCVVPAFKDYQNACASLPLLPVLHNVLFTLYQLCLTKPKSSVYCVTALRAEQHYCNRAFCSIAVVPEVVLKFSTASTSGRDLRFCTSPATSPAAIWGNRVIGVYSLL